MRSCRHYFFFHSLFIDLFFMFGLLAQFFLVVKKNTI